LQKWQQGNQRDDILSTLLRDKGINVGGDQAQRTVNLPNEAIFAIEDSIPNFQQAEVTVPPNAARSLINSGMSNGDRMNRLYNQGRVRVPRLLQPITAPSDRLEIGY